MSCYCSDNKDMLSFIQGDTFNLEITINNEETDNDIAEVYFSSKGLNLTKSLTKNANCTWTLLITDKETAAMHPGIFEFDLTAVYEDNSVCTAIYRDKLNILRKTNT